MATSDPLVSDLKRSDDSSSLQKLEARTLEVYGAPTPAPTRTIIWSFGELGTGTEYGGEAHLVGAWSLFKQSADEGRAPNLIVFHGEAIVKIPPFITKGGLEEALVIKPHIDEFDHGVIATKPYLSRIADVAKENGTRLVYVISASDTGNIKNWHQNNVNAYTYKPSILLDLRAAYKTRVESVSEAVEATRADEKKYTQALEEANNELRGATKKHGIEVAEEAVNINRSIRVNERLLKTARQKLAEKSEELADYQKILNLYSEFVKLWIKRNRGPFEEDIYKAFEVVVNKLYGKGTDIYDENVDPDLFDLFAQTLGPKEVKKQLNDTRTKRKAVEKQLEKLDSVKEKDEFDRLTLEKKSLINLETKLSFERTEEARSAAQRDETIRNQAANRHNRNAPGMPSTAQQSNEIAKAIVLASIRDAFGRRMSVEIVEKTDETIRLNGLKIKVTNKPSNTSPAFVHNPIRALEGMLADEPVDYILASRSPIARSKLVPVKDGSPDRAQLIVSPPMFNPEGYWRVYSQKIKTTFTEMSTKGTPTFGFDEMEFDGVRMHHTFHTTHELTALADRVKIAEIEILAKLLETPLIGNNLQPLDDRDHLQLKSKLPSEIRASQDTRRFFNSLLEELGIDPNDMKLRTALAQKVRDMATGGEVRDVEKWELTKGETVYAIANILGKKDLQSMTEIEKTIDKMSVAPDSPELAKALKWIREYIAPAETDRTSTFNKLNIKAVTDTHIGSEGAGEPTVAVLKAWTNFALDELKKTSEPYLMFINGDVVEGDLRHHKYEAYDQYLPRNIEEFRKWERALWLQKQSIVPKGVTAGSTDPEHIHLLARQAKHPAIDPDSTAFTHLENEYKARLYDKTPIHSWDEQMNRAAEMIGPLFVHELCQGGAAVPGNHPRTVDRILAESAGVMDRIHIPEDRKRNFKVFNEGSDQGGSGSIKIAGGPSVGIAHQARAELELEKRRSSDIITVAGHIHEPTMTIIGDKAVVTGAALQGITHFPRHIGIPTSQELRGVSEFSIVWDEKGRAVRFTETTTTQGDLRKLRDAKGEPYLRGAHPLIQKFENERNTVVFEPEGIRALQRLELGKTTVKSVG